MRKVIEFSHKCSDMFKLGCTLPNVANIFLHFSTSAKFQPITESDKDFISKVRQDMVGGP